MRCWYNSRKPSRQGLSLCVGGDCEPSHCGGATDLPAPTTSCELSKLEAREVGVGGCWCGLLP
eukprot:1407835-Amphidinium_carterae.4